jgi:hypothetical protein
MDVATLATAFVASQHAQIQLAVAAAMMRSNMQAETSVVELVNAAQDNAARMANLAAGIGGNLDVMA